MTYCFYLYIPKGIEMTTDPHVWEMPKWCEENFATDHVKTKVMKSDATILPFLNQSWGGAEDDVWCDWLSNSSCFLEEKNGNERVLLWIKDIWSILANVQKKLSMTGKLSRKIVDRWRKSTGQWTWLPPTFISPMLSKWQCKYGKSSIQNAQGQSVVKLLNSIMCSSDLRRLYCLTHKLSITFTQEQQGLSEHHPLLTLPIAAASNTSSQSKLTNSTSQAGFKIADLLAAGASSLTPTRVLVCLLGVVFQWIHPIHTDCFKHFWTTKAKLLLQVPLWRISAPLGGLPWASWRLWGRFYIGFWFDMEWNIYI